MHLAHFILLVLALPHISASPYHPDLLLYNINSNKDASDPTQYSASLHQSYTPSPKNWRALPTYTILMDKFADGDPSNNDYFGTMFEYDHRETQLRFGGDLKGLLARLDYIQAMGIKLIFVSGTPFLNMLWQADSYSPLDFTVLDPHWGTLADWQHVISEIHARGMYFMADFTVGTMADLIGFRGYLNTSTPFSLNEHIAVWKHPEYVPWNFTEYRDFSFNNTRNYSCTMPTFWLDSGAQITLETKGCMDSDFDQYGDTEAFGVHPDWQRQLAKFASVQDRLREWKPSVMTRLKKFSCMTIQALDIDAIRIDKATQVTLDALAEWATSTRACAAELGKANFFIPGEVTGGDTFGALYIGRGRTPIQLPPGFLASANITPSQSDYFLRPRSLSALDGVAFHYSIYRSLSRFLGMDGNLQVAYDVDTNFATAWNQIFVANDLINSMTDKMDPRHMFGVGNFDVFRWSSLDWGKERAAVASFVASLVLPGIPLYFYGEEQNMYLYDTGASNYLYGRQAMPGTLAWKRHGCYKLGSEQYFNMPLRKGALGCYDDWNALDHFDPTTDSRRLFTQFNALRQTYGALQDGWNLVQRGNWTYRIERPGSNHTETEMGLWSISRSGIPGVQDGMLGGTYNDQVWMLYTNENVSKTWSFDCKQSLWISSPYQSGTTVRNLFAPYETYVLADSLSGYYNNSNLGQGPFYGCLESVMMEPYGFKMLVPVEQWTPPLPALTRFWPGHDARVLNERGNVTEVEISLEFNTEMNCDGVSGAIEFEMASSGRGGVPKVSSVTCGAVVGGGQGQVQGVSMSVWAWNATLVDFPDGVLTITMNNAPTQDGKGGTGVVDHLMLRKGAADNVMVFPDNDYSDGLTFSDGHLHFEHKAFGADMLRYSLNFGMNYTNWTSWEDTTTIQPLEGMYKFWQGDHIMVQYWSRATMSTAHVVHADYGYTGHPRRVPQFLARGPFNQWGFDKGLPHTMMMNAQGKWELEIMASWPTYIQLNVWGFDDYYYGDTDGDGVLDRLPPNTNAPNYLNMSAPPPPHLAWALIVDDHSMTWTLVPRGQASVGVVMYALLLIIPVITACLAVMIFMWSFYGIKHNRFGVKAKSPSNKYFPILSAALAFANRSTSDFKGTSTTVSEKIFKPKINSDIIGWPEDKHKRRKVLIATLEYEVIDWKLKVKIGGLGVMSSLMGKAMTDVDLIWVVPKVKDIEYPPGEPAEPIEVIIFGEPYLIEVETHVYDNITYVILDSPVFRAQTKADPYPARMDDLSSAIFYSTWNQAIAATVRKFPTVDVYHINDYHGALAPIYLLPKVLPVCLSLHNAEFQGLWPLRTKEEMKEVCSAFNISKEHCTKYVQFGNTFNLLHAAASFISVHQKSVGVAGVSDKYGKRSWARYPALWTLKQVDSLPNPDPSDIAALDENPTAARDIKIDAAAEAARPELKRQAQEWAGIKQDPSSDLFVFVGRWSKQKGVDLIADIMPGLLEKRSTVQLIAVGPVIDLYGRFAAEKLARLMEMYPDRVYSKPEFTALPPYLFSGADFALIPSRDEPFGLVAVEFGRKGALGVGSRLGGLGLMPGWWYPVESSSTAHMLSQLTKTIKMALKSTEEERAILRARSAVQRFPVVEWRQRMEDIHKRSITASRGVAGDDAWRVSDCDGGNAEPVEIEDCDPVHQPAPQPEWHNSGMALESPRLNPPGSPGAWSQDTLTLTPGREGVSMSDSTRIDVGYSDFLERANRTIARDQCHAPDRLLGVQATPTRPFNIHSRASSVESISSIVDEKYNSPLNKAIQTFTDADGGVAADFVQKLRMLNAKNSEHELSIEKYLIRSEEAFFGQVRKEKLSGAASIRSARRDSAWGAPSPSPSLYSRASSPNTRDSTTEFGELRAEAASPSADIAPMTGLQIFMSREFKGWPLYAIVMALGQMLSATSFQITLLTGRNWQDNVQLYVLGAVFLAASAVWYSMFRLKPSVYVLSAPWIFFGLAFLCIGIPSVLRNILSSRGHRIIANVATWCYAVASAASFLFFGLNFGEEAGAATEVWTLRACVVQGSQQVWVAALWYWGYHLNGQKEDYTPPWWTVLIVWPLAMLSFIFSYLMLYGLPEYYRQTPPKVPYFLRTLVRRKLVLWFLASEILRDYWLSGPYGRNWSFLWNVEVPKWRIFLLVITFFVFVWAGLLLALTHFSKTHTWLLPVFAVGLGAPRWCQMLWGTSSLALYIPWAGSGGPYLGLSLWLWLGVLDAVQGVGLGMILLQTLSRLHVCATLAFSQIIGSVCVMIARATAPNAIGPESVFPDAAKWDFSDGLKGSPMAAPMFWIALESNIMTDLTFCYLHMSKYDLTALDTLETAEYIKTDLADDELDIPSYMIPPNPEDGDSPLLPSQVHPSYPYGNPTNIKHPAAKPRPPYDPASRALYEDMGYEGGGVAGALRWKDMALEVLLPTDEAKEMSEKAAKARKMASGATNQGPHPQPQQPVLTPGDQTIEDEDEEDEEDDEEDENDENENDDDEASEETEEEDE
uniref:alpha-1,3-glucan synthase n=1 Tax=Moniliophthora roreri TaxID=221103 RepID=A0A0W0GDS6_MONRR